MKTKSHRAKLLTTLGIGVLMAALAAPAFAGFAGTDLYIPMAGLGAGAFGSTWYTTVWIYNPNASTVTAQLYFLTRNANNSAVTPVAVDIAAGETKIFENIVGTTFGKSPTVFGAIRIAAASKLVASARVYAKAGTAPLSQSFGQDFAGIPSSFAVGLSEPTEILGGYNTMPDSTSLARFNVGCVEVTGHQVTVQWQVRDATGAVQWTYSRNVLPYSQSQGSWKDWFPLISLTNARVTATITAGTGKIIAYGSMVTNDTTTPKPVQDPTTFDMLYPGSLLPHSTGLFHGAVWSSDGLVIEGGLELNISSLGVVSYNGSAGLQCGTDALYTLSLDSTPASPLTISATGDFTAPGLVIAYEDGGVTVFTTTWTLAGNIDKDGIVTGTLRSDTTGGAGAWAACNGTNVLRNWRGGWTKNP